MRMLTEFPTEKEAKALSDHLEVGGIEVVIRGSKPFEVWVLDDDLVEQAGKLLASFDAKEDKSAAATTIRSKREKAAKPKATIVTTPSRDVAVGRATMALMIVSVTVFLMSSFGDTVAGALEALHVTPPFEYTGRWKAPTVFDWSEPWRLITPIFIHNGFMHIVFNMVWLYHFGNQIEAYHGTPKFLLLVALFAIPGNFFQLHLGGPWFGGMSGVLFGLFGFVWMQARYANRGYGIESREVVIMMVWLVLCVSGALRPFLGDIANITHAVGLVFGILAGVPAYFQYRSSHNMITDFSKGSWADQNVVGWQRFHRRFLSPYAPFWFLTIAMAVILIDAA